MIALRSVQPLTWLFVLVSVAAILSFAGLDDRAPDRDARGYTTLGYNLAAHGVFSLDEAPENGSPQPSMKREPGLPAAYAIGMLLTGLVDRTPDSSCVINSREPACHTVLMSTRYVNVIFYLALIVLSYAGTVLVLPSARWRLLLAAAVGGTSYFSGLTNDNLTETPAAVFLLGATLAMHAAVMAPRHRWLWAIVSGLCLAALMLTRAIFLYAGPALLVFGLIIALRRRESWSFLALGLITFVAYLSASPWIARNMELFGEHDIASSRNVLAIRAEYNQLGLAEYSLAYIMFTPSFGDDLAKFIASKDAVRNLGRNDKGGYYRRVMGGGGRAAEATGLAHPDQEQMAKAALHLLLTEWPKTLAMVPLFAYRGIFLDSGTGFPLLEKHAPLLRELQKGITKLLFLPLMPLGIGIFLWALFTGRTNELLVLLLPMFSYGLLSLLTQNIPRFSAPLIPCLFLAAILVLRQRPALVAFLARPFKPRGAVQAQAPAE